MNDKSDTNSKSSSSNTANFLKRSFFFKPHDQFGSETLYYLARFRVLPREEYRRALIDKLIALNAGRVVESGECVELDAISNLFWSV